MRGHSLEPADDEPVDDGPADDPGQDPLQPARPELTPSLPSSCTAGCGLLGRHVPQEGLPLPADP